MEQRTSPLESMGVNASFWQGRSVFVTGHTGFKGGWLCLWLQSLGAKVTGYALAPPTRPSLFEVARIAAGMTSVIGDIRDLPALLRAMQAAQPEIVIHMAAQPLVRRSYTDPVETYSTNIMGTVHVLESVRQTPGVRAVVNVTTDKCYENKEWAWGYRENEPMGGFDPYSSSKAGAELVTAAYRSSFFNATSHEHERVSVATARAGNVIGGGDWADDRLVPDILRAFERNQPVIIRNPHAIRPWQHVLEPLSGYLSLAERLYSDGQAFAEAWNFGPNDHDARPVQWIVEHLVRRCGNGASWQQDGGAHPHEAHYLKLDISKARMRLNWHPHWNLAIGLDKIVEWHNAFTRQQDMYNFSLNQIMDFQTPAGDLACKQ